MTGPIIAIDGPAASGKTTVAQLLATRLGLAHVDTGAMYRALALKAMRTDRAAGTDLAGLTENTRIELQEGRVLLDGEDVTAQIRSSAVTAVVSDVAADPSLRAWMVELQRRLVGPDGVVMEGRDIGTVVLPDADLKVFLTADESERAARRAKELSADAKDLAETLDAVRRRDHQDSNRLHSPLVAAKDAIIIDSTKSSPEQIVESLIDRLGTKK